MGGEATIEVLSNVEAASDGLELARMLSVLRPKVVGIDLGDSSLGRTILALPAIVAVVRHFPEARLAIRARQPGLALLQEHFGAATSAPPQLTIDLRPRAKQRASFDEATRSLFVPACPYPWRTQHASAHFADGATSAGLLAQDPGIQLALKPATRARAAQLVRERYGLRHPLVALLGRRRGWGSARWSAVAAGLSERIGARVLDVGALDAPAPVRAAALALCAVCVGDSGDYAHVAAVVGAAIVTVHGRACPLRQGPASHSGAAVFATCREPERHHSTPTRQRRCLECLEPERVVDAAERLAAERWPRDRLRRLWT